MCFGTDDDAPIEFAQDELVEKGPDGQRMLQMGMTVWNSTPAKEAQMVSGRWEGNRTYNLSWEEFLSLHASMTRQIEFLKPLIESGKVLVK